MISARCAFCVPTHGMTSVLNPIAPTIAPSVFAAYTPPTSRPGSWPRSAAAAKASGKLAPHNSAGGKIAQVQRNRSS
jgi:hypothetical protein